MFELFFHRSYLKTTTIIYIKKEKFFFSQVLLHFFGYSFSFEKKKDTYHGGFQKCFIRFCEISKHTAIATQKKKKKIEKLLIQTQKENQEKSDEKQWEYQQKHLDYQQKQLEYQKEMEQKQLKYQKKIKEKKHEFRKEVLELTSRGNSRENEYSFSQNTVWSATENFLYSLEEDVTLASYIRRYEDLYKTDCGNWSDP